MSHRTLDFDRRQFLQGNWQFPNSLAAVSQMLSVQMLSALQPKFHELS
jgi:hypothetical protein